MAVATVERLRSGAGAGVPPGAIDIFERYASEWARAADDGSDRFLWVDDVELDLIGQISSHWGRIMGVAHAVPLSGEERRHGHTFHLAVAVGMARALDAVRKSVDAAASAPVDGGRAQTATRARLVLASGDPQLNSEIRRELERLPRITIVAEAHDGHEAIRLARELRPELVLIDLALPDLRGIPAVRLILASSSACAVVVRAGGEERTAVLEASAEHVDREMGAQAIVATLHALTDRALDPLHATRRRLPGQQTSDDDLVTVIAHSLAASIRAIEAVAVELRDLVASGEDDDPDESLAVLVTHARHVCSVLGDIVRGGAAAGVDALQPR